MANGRCISDGTTAPAPRKRCSVGWRPCRLVCPRYVGAWPIQKPAIINRATSLEKLVADNTCLGWRGAAPVAGCVVHGANRPSTVVETRTFVLSGGAIFG